ncbi:hypothetical protein NKI20_29210 [Mesorhizobium sp. M0830]|uniref:hypothetical protein n=1 Tax=Mesorhizobium sp. M0830 TaxID=2957008 RepID=UPI003337183D
MLTKPASIAAFSSPGWLASSRPMRGWRISAGSAVGSLMLNQWPSVAQSARDCHGEAISVPSHRHR